MLNFLCFLLTPICFHHEDILVPIHVLPLSVGYAIVDKFHIRSEKDSCRVEVPPPHRSRLPWHRPGPHPLEFSSALQFSNSPVAPHSPLWPGFFLVLSGIY